MSRSLPDVDSFVNDFDGDEIETLVSVVAQIDPLEIVNGKPRWDRNEMDLIMKFRDFAGVE